ncbi:hypothetical protein [Chryseobacterium echinoideorum]|uniref:hypothetical protein n=1 Tax=Chryseobacterium echinoideorum TaxID=1549648 RepID=UPI0011864CC1|nr:hypothetical protein [Chryseobacterium echinoideorum]
MKKNILMTLAFLLLAFITVKANNNEKVGNDKEYFSSFKKNEEPKNKKFNILSKSSDQKGDAFYVIYKKNSKGEGFYFKVVLDKNEKPIATYYAIEDKEISENTVANLKKLLTGPENSIESLAETPTQCVTKCHRTKGCYDKPTTSGVLLCSLECGVECA